MRVLIDYRPALRDRTGVGEWVHQIVEALAATDQDSSLELTLFSCSWKDRLRQPLPPRVDSIDRRIPVRLLNYCWHRLGWPPAETLTGQQFDVVHSPHPLLIPTRSAAQVITIHDLDFLDHPERTTAEVRRDYPQLVKKHVRRASHVVVPSHYTAEQVEQRLGVSPENISLCPNGPPSWRPREHPRKRGHLLFVGTLSPRKNVKGLFEAYAQLLRRRPDIPPLVLAGQPMPSAAEALATLEHPPLRGRVRCTGYLKKEDLHRYYENACALILPSLDEGFGLPALEAMTVGVPVIATNRGALPEVLGNAGLLVDPADPTGLADAVERLLDEPALASCCVERGRAQAVRYSWAASARALRQAYDKAVACGS